MNDQLMPIQLPANRNQRHQCEIQPPKEKALGRGHAGDKPDDPDTKVKETDCGRFNRRAAVIVKVGKDPLGRAETADKRQERNGDQKDDRSDQPGIFRFDE